MNQYLNDELKINSAFDSNNLNDKPKIKRPNSCGPNIVINREIQEPPSSVIFNSEAGYNVSHKTCKTKPASGKTRTNGSYSTNVFTTP